MSYLADLTLRLAAAAERLPPDVRDRHAGYLRDAQRPDGGFGGRDGGSDLYYTGFATRGLAMLGQLEGEVAAATGRFLLSRLSSQAPVVDLVSLLSAGVLLSLAAGIDIFSDSPAAWRDGLAAELDRLHRPDGGCAKGAEGQKSSTYHTFLVLLCHQLIDRPIPDPDGIAAFLLSQRREDGGFVEIQPMQRSGTNPTAAAVAALKMVDQLSPQVAHPAADFLAGMQTEEGGLRANTRIPTADLLSTFTGLLTLLDLEAAGQIDLAAAGKYAAGLEDSQGGFHGAVWDSGTDVEYTFYGLGTLALVHRTLP